ncbi:MAG: DUF2066 domain-containing protein [Thiohalobacteraceae bacterium]
MSWIVSGSRSVRLLLAALLLTTATALPALQSVHEAAVPVPDRSDAARERGVREALGEVLVRLSGERAVLSRPGAEALLAKPGRYLQKYQYEQVEGLVLRAGFDATALEDAMRDYGLPLWGRTRSPLLVWLAVDDGDRQSLLGAGDAEPLAAELQAAAQRHGVELILPLADLEDQTRLGYNDVASGDLTRIAQASERYQAQAVLAGQLQRQNGAWTGRWVQRAAGGATRWQDRAATPGALLDQALGEAAQRLAPRAPQSSYADLAASRLTVAVEAVGGLDDYARVAEYLRGLALVSGVGLMSIGPGQLEFQVDVQGGAAALDQALAGDALLVPVPRGGMDDMLRYRLRP